MRIRAWDHAFQALAAASGRNFQAEATFINRCRQAVLTRQEKTLCQPIKTKLLK
jgi:hypothetical protein